MRIPSGQTKSLAHFLALSLALHGLVLGAVAMHNPSTPAVEMGGPELRVQMVSPGSSRNAAPTASSRSFTSAADTRTARVATEAQRDAVPGNPGQHSTEGATALENYLIGRLQTELSRHLVYPHLARERGWQGTVLISVMLAPDGVVQGLRLVHSSGHFLLDEASLAGLRKLRTLSLAGGPHWKDPVEVMLPIRFQLIDNS